MRADTRISQARPRAVGGTPAAHDRRGPRTGAHTRRTCAHRARKQMLIDQEGQGRSPWCKPNTKQTQVYHARLGASSWAHLCDWMRAACGGWAVDTHRVGHQRHSFGAPPPTRSWGKVKSHTGNTLRWSESGCGPRLARGIHNGRPLLDKHAGFLAGSQ